MDAKEIKSALKAAREAIRTKDFETATRQCKRILETDEKNYNALVFLGVATEGLDQPDQALKAYRKAVEEVSDQPLAWQGFGSLLEKHPTLVESQEAVAVFTKLLNLNAGDETKKVSVLHKLADVYVKANMHKEAYAALLELLAIEKEGDGRIASCHLLVNVLNSKVFELKHSHYEQYLQCLSELLDCPTSDGEQVESYLTQLLYATAKHNMNAFSTKCDEMRKKFPKAVTTLELTVRFEVERSIGGNAIQISSAVKHIEEHLQCLKELNPQSCVVKTAEGFLEYQRRNYLQAKKTLSEIDSESLCVLYFLAKSSSATHNYSVCLDTCAKGLTACADPKTVVLVPVVSISDSFKLAQAEALRNQGSHEDLVKAVAILEEVKEERPQEAAFLMSLCFLYEGKHQEAELSAKQLPKESVQAKILKALIYMQNKSYSQAVNILRGVVETAPENPLATLKLGIALWNLRDSDEVEQARQLCFNTLLKAAKLDPYNFESFLFLGYFYQQVQKDINKARRCFQKAFDLNPNKDDVGCALVDILLEINEKDQAIAILKEVTSQAAAGRGKWAWLRLGLHQIKCEDPTIAIASLQSALRSDPKDHHIWECLAEAYLHRGSLTAALKAFTKASELKPDSIYCLYQMASVRQTLGLLPQAIQEYKEILEREHCYVPALKGLGESLVLLARQNLRQCLDGLAQDCCEDALVYLARAASQRSDFACLWKLMGDACSAVSQMASNSFCVPSKMLSRGTQNAETKIQVTKMQMLEIGSRCYSAAIKILPQNSSVWHDLGVSLYRQCTEAALAANAEFDVCVKLLDRAKKAMQKALTIDVSNWQHWNSLGVMACSKVNYKPAFAQHCFIKSIECEANNVLAWSNLGSLYLSEGQIQMAHDAFKAAQRLDPTYIVGWIGQALIAEIVGHEEVMDLFRHTTDLAAHPESQLGYGQFVLGVLRDESKLETELFNFCIHQMAAIPSASDALVKYTVRNKSDPIAYNMLGLIFEHQNLFTSSIEAFTISLNLLAKEDSRDVKKDVQMNFARVLCKQGRYEESVHQFSLLADHLDFHHLCLYGLAEYKCSNFVQSLKVYQFAAQKLSEADDAVQSQLYTAMGMVAYKAGDEQEARSHLFNGFQTQCPSFHGLLALCALGLLQSDSVLTSAVLKEFEKRPDVDNLSVQVSILKLYALVQQGSVTAGECMLREMLEGETTVPDPAALCELLAGYLVLTFSHLGLSAVECLRSCSGARQPPKTLTSWITESIAQLQAGHHSPFDVNANAFKTAQKAFHQHPGDTRSMCTLASAAHAEGIVRKSASDNLSLFLLEKALLVAVLEREDKSSQVYCWSLKQLAVCCVEIGCKSEALECLKQLEEHFPDASLFVKAMKLYLSSSLPLNLNASQLKDLDSFSLRMSAALLAFSCQHGVIVDVLEQLTAGEKIKCPPLSKTALMELLTFLVFEQVQSETETSELRKAFENAVNVAKEKELGSPIMSLMHGIDSFPSNKRLTKHLFAAALDQCQARADNGWCKSLARQRLMALLHDSSKESDVQLVQALLQDAKQDNDKVTVAMHAQLAKK